MEGEQEERRKDEQQEVGKNEKEEDEEEEEEEEEEEDEVVDKARDSGQTVYTEKFTLNVFAQDPPSSPARMKYTDEFKEHVWSIWNGRDKSKNPNWAEIAQKAVADYDQYNGFKGESARKLVARWEKKKLEKNAHGKETEPATSSSSSSSSSTSGRFGVGLLQTGTSSSSSTPTHDDRGYASDLQRLIQAKLALAQQEVNLYQHLLRLSLADMSGSTSVHQVCLT
jgi:hypothetical protein